MKSYITILFFLSCQSFSSAQSISIDSFYRDGATWTQYLYSETWPHGITDCYENNYIGYSLLIQGDSVVDSSDYRLLYYKYLGGRDSEYCEGYFYGTGQWNCMMSTDLIPYSDTPVFDVLSNLDLGWHALILVKNEYNLCKKMRQLNKNGINKNLTKLN